MLSLHWNKISKINSLSFGIISVLSLSLLAYSAEGKPGVSGMLSLSPIPMVHFKIEAQLLSKTFKSLSRIWLC